MSRNGVTGWFQVFITPFSSSSPITTRNGWALLWYFRGGSPTDRPNNIKKPLRSKTTGCPPSSRGRNGQEDLIPPGAHPPDVLGLMPPGLKPDKAHLYKTSFCKRWVSWMETLRKNTPANAKEKHRKAVGTGKLKRAEAVFLEYMAHSSSFLSI